MHQQTKRIKEILAVWIFILISCDRPECVNTNPVFDKYSPVRKEYKDELAKGLKNAGNDEIRYWFENYEKDVDGEYIHVLVQGNGICAKTKLNVKSWTGMENIKRTQGKGYAGAELENLVVDIYQDSSRTEFTVASVGHIKD